MLEDIFDALILTRQDLQFRDLRRRLDLLQATRPRSAPDPERNLAAAVIGLLITKGVITPDELAGAMEAIDAAQIAKIGNLAVPDVGPPADSAETIDAAKIAELDTSAADPATQIKLDLN
jgi:hypothetical protein